MLTDFLIRAALQRRYGEAELAPLPDQLEHAARDAAVARHQGSRPGRSAAGAGRPFRRLRPGRGWPLNAARFGP